MDRTEFPPTEQSHSRLATPPKPPKVVRLRQPSPFKRYYKDLHLAVDLEQVDAVSCIASTRPELSPMTGDVIPTRCLCIYLKSGGTINLTWDQSSHNLYKNSVDSLMEDFQCVGS